MFRKRNVCQHFAALKAGKHLQFYVFSIQIIIFLQKSDVCQLLVEFQPQAGKRPPRAKYWETYPPQKKQKWGLRLFKGSFHFYFQISFNVRFCQNIPYCSMSKVPLKIAFFFFEIICSSCLHISIFNIRCNSNVKNSLYFGLNRLPSTSSCCL